MPAAASIRTWNTSLAQLYTARVRAVQDSTISPPSNRGEIRRGFYLSVRYKYRVSQIPYSVGVVLPKIFLTALSRSESVV